MAAEPLPRSANRPPSQHERPYDDPQLQRSLNGPLPNPFTRFSNFANTESAHGAPAALALEESSRPEYFTGETFELADLSYTRGVKRDPTGERDARRERRRREKLERLHEEAEMKFSHSIQFNAVPDWSSHYIAYSNLKKL